MFRNPAIFKKNKTKTLYHYYIPWIASLDKGGLTFGYTMLMLPFQIDMNFNAVIAELKKDYESKQKDQKVASMTILNIVLLRTREVPIDDTVTFSAEAQPLSQ